MNLRVLPDLILPACAGIVLAVVVVKVADAFASYVMTVLL